MADTSTTLAPVAPALPALQPSPAWSAALDLAWTALARPLRLAAAASTPCSGCGLGPDGLRDAVHRGLHLCRIRTDALRAAARPAIPSAALASRAVLSTLDGEVLSGLGRVGSAFLSSGSGLRRVRWDEVADWLGDARRPWWIPGPEVSFEARLAARAALGDAVRPAPAAARRLVARVGTALAPMPLSAIRRAGWVLVACAGGRDPSVAAPMLSAWLARARGPVIGLGARVAGAGEHVRCPPGRVAALLAAVAGGPVADDLPEAEIADLRRRLRGPGVVVVDGGEDDPALADAVLAVTAERPPGPAHGWVWTWSSPIWPFAVPTAPAPREPDLVVLHGAPTLTPEEEAAVRRAPRRLHLAVSLDPRVTWPGEVALLPARPAFEQGGSTALGWDRRVRFVDHAGEPVGESRSDLSLVAFLAGALGRAAPDDPEAVRAEAAVADPRLAGLRGLARPGDHTFLGGPFLPAPGPA